MYCTIYYRSRDTKKEIFQSYLLKEIDRALKNVFDILECKFPVRKISTLVVENIFKRFSVLTTKSLHFRLYFMRLYHLLRLSLGCPRFSNIVDIIMRMSLQQRELLYANIGNEYTSTIDYQYLTLYNKRNHRAIC